MIKKIPEVLSGIFGISQNIYMEHGWDFAAKLKILLKA